MAGQALDTIVIPVSLSFCGIKKGAPKTGGKKDLGEFVSNMIFDRLHKMGVNPNDHTIIIEDPQNPENAMVFSMLSRPKQNPRRRSR
ncbi:MAG TPA: hypothetical protein VJJ80_03575 [Patescibacteria group bacterium]|nr:hypothetical protein [Patescibacteria group bacterium]